MVPSQQKGKQYIISVFFSVLAVMLNYIIMLLLTPYITENIGTEAFGFVSLAKTFANYASIITVALNSFSARFISVEFHKGNIKKANQYFNSVFIADCVIGLLIMIVTICIVYNLQFILRIPPELLSDVKLLFVLDMFNFLVLSCSTVFMSATIIKNRLELGSIIKCIAYLAEGAFLLCVYKVLVPKVFYVGISLILSSVIIFVLNIVVNNKYTPELRLQKGFYSKDALKNVVVNGIWNSINSLGNTLNSGLDLLVTNMLLSALRSGQLAIVKTISLIITTMFQLLAQPLQPLQLKYYAKGERDQLIHSFTLGIKINGWLSNIAFGGLVIFGYTYYSLWVPNQDISLLQSVTIVTVIGSVIEGAVYPLYYIYTLTLKNRIPCIVTVGSGFINVVGMYVLIKYFSLGIYAVVGTTAVLTWCVNFVFNPMYSAYCLKLNKSVFYPTLIRHIVSCVAITGSFWLIAKFFYPETWIGLIAIALLGFLLGSVIHLLLVFDKEERQMVKNLLIKQH